MSIQATAPRLRRWNLWAGLLHLVTGIAIVVLSTDFSLPVTAGFLSDDPAMLEQPATPEVLFRLRIGWGVATFALLSALAHFVVASPWGHPRYVAWLGRGQNPFRWIEYSLSASVMMVLIAMLTGILDAAALVAIFAVNAAMILFGLVMERVNEGREAVDWLPFWFGCIAGIAPWIAVGIYLGGAASPPGFVYGIFASLFVFFNVFAVNMVLHYRRRGRWADPLFGERVYIGLSFAAKSTLAWWVFAATLR